MHRKGTRLFRYDRDLRSAEFALVAGADEVGRGCIAGPLVAAAIVLPPDARLPHVDDSKMLPAKAREEQAERIRSVALALAIAFVAPRTIDRVNIRRANLLALEAAVRRLHRRLARRIAESCEGIASGGAGVLLLVDGRDEAPNSPWPQRAVIDGDAKSLAVAAASIVAKTVRDRFMSRVAALHPEYGFERHKGYGTAEHLEALERLGPCAWHRYSFTPVAQPKLFSV